MAAEEDISSSVTTLRSREITTASASLASSSLSKGPRDLVDHVASLTSIDTLLTSLELSL